MSWLSAAKLEDLTANMGLLGPEVPDSKALAIPLDRPRSWSPIRAS